MGLPILMKLIAEVSFNEIFRNPKMSYTFLDDNKNIVLFLGKKRGSLWSCRIGFARQLYGPLTSCQCDTSLWLQGKYPGSDASGSGGHPSEMSSGSSGKK